MFNFFFTKKIFLLYKWVCTNQMDNHFVENQCSDNYDDHNVSVCLFVYHEMTKKNNNKKKMWSNWNWNTFIDQNMVQKNFISKSMNNCIIIIENKTKRKWCWSSIIIIKWLKHIIFNRINNNNRNYRHHHQLNDTGFLNTVIRSY